MNISSFKLYQVVLGQSGQAFSGAWKDRAIKLCAGLRALDPAVLEHPTLTFMGGNAETVTFEFDPRRLCFTAHGTLNQSALPEIPADALRTGPDQDEFLPVFEQFVSGDARAFSFEPADGGRVVLVKIHERLEIFAGGLPASSPVAAPVTTS